MPIREIVRLGDPVLREPAAPVDPAEIASADFQQLVDDLFETMREAGGVGLAAPQVGVGKQLFVYGVEGEDPGEDGGSVPARVVVNPLLTPEAGEPIHDWEGCLSIPGLRGLVPRHPAVRVQGLDRHGRPLDYVAAGFEARIVQHEHDHLNGVVFLDRMRDLRSLCFEEEWRRFLESSDPTGHIAVG
jgi:peptide deformylase